MKKRMIWVVLAAMLLSLLAGCGPTDPTAGSVAPSGTNPGKTDPPTTGTVAPEPTDGPKPTDAPDDLLRDEEQLRVFQTMFEFPNSTNDFWNLALFQAYQDPLDANLYKLFYNGFNDESPITDEEKQALFTQSWEGELSITRCPVEKMNRVLQEIFGLSLSDYDQAALEKFTYLESTGSYYLFHNDAAGLSEFKAEGYRLLEDGCVELVYSYDNGARTGAVILKPEQDGYRIISNSLAN